MSTTPTVIDNLSELQAIANDPSGNYVLGGNIDAAGYNFTPIADFTGTLDGQGYTISDLTIDASAQTTSVGLFGIIGSGAQVKNLTLKNANITASAGASWAGVVAAINEGQILSVSVTGSNVSGGPSVEAGNALDVSDSGGLVGANLGTISLSSANATVSSPGGTVGGLAGENDGLITQDYSIGSATSVTNTPQAGVNVGGLVGINSSGTISESYSFSSTSVTGYSAAAGGLVGINLNGTISNSYARGSVTGGAARFESLGGFVGENILGGISASYSTGSVSGGGSGSVLGGFIPGMPVIFTYSLGPITNSYWDTQASGQANSAGGSGLTTSQLEGGLPDGFDPTVWAIIGQYPYLQSNPPKAYSVSPNPASVNENNGALTFTVTRPDSSTAETVYVSTVQNQGYYNAASGTTSTSYYYGSLVNVPYNFAIGQSSIQVPVAIYDHGLPSGSETFGFQVQDASGNEVASTNFTIDNTDTGSETYSLSPNPAAVNEDAGALSFMLTRSDNSEQEIVNVSTSQDEGYYNALSGTTSTNYYYDGLDDKAYTFLAGQSSIPVTITINDRGLTEGSEEFGLGVENPSGANVASTTFTILNSDPATANPMPTQTDIPPTINYTGPVALSDTVNSPVDFSNWINATDAGGKVAYYQFSLASGAGSFTRDGGDTGSSLKVPANQLFEVGFNPGSTVGTDNIQVVAIDSQNGVSEPYDIPITVTAPNAAPVATDSILGYLANDSYKDEPVSLYGFVPLDTDDVDGFRGVVYSNDPDDPNSSEIVIAFRGSDSIENWLVNIETYGTDLTTGWGPGAAAFLSAYFNDAVTLLQQVKLAYPDAALQLTGHSLGGAIAELLGTAAHLDVTALDAPGTGDFYSALLSDTLAGQSSFLTNLAEQNASWSDINYRMYGDVVSKIGTPIRTSHMVTLPWPGKLINLNAIDAHDVKLLAQQVQAFDAEKVAALPNDLDDPLIPYELIASAPGTISGAVNALEAYFAGPAANVVTSSSLPGDPTDFVYLQNPGSPNIVSVNLPTLPGVQSYEVRYETGTSWSPFQQVWPEEWQAPGSNVDGIEFIPLDPTGHSVDVTSSIMFGLVFGATGTVDGTLTSSTPITVTVTTASGIDLRWATLYDELANSPIQMGGSTTQYICVDTGRFNGHMSSLQFVVTGTGLTYSGSFPNVQLTGGTITGIQEEDSSDTVLATFTGLSISATTFQLALNTYTAGGANPDPSGLNAIFLGLGYNVTGGPGPDQFQGGSLNETIVCSAGNDAIDGGTGNNTADYSNLTTSGIVAIIQGGGGTVNKGGANGSDTLTGVQNLIGSSGSDVFYADTNETVTGGGGFEYLIELSAGINLAYGTNFTGISEFVSNVGTNTIDFSSDPDFAYLFGSTGNDTLTLGTGGGYMFGEGGANVLTGGANATNLFVGGDGGSDIMNGGTGTASNYYFVDGNDQVNGAGAFNAVVELVTGVTVQLGGAQYQDVQEFVGNSGNNIVTVADTDTDFVYLYGGSGNDTISTGSSGGYLIGEGGTNILTGGGGLNVFVADSASGADTMNGGTGSNIYYIGANSTVLGAGTFNTVIELQQNATLTLGSAQLGTDVQQVILNGGTNTADFHTATSSVFLYGGAGNDTLFGGTGNDFLYAGTGTNTFEFATGWGQDTIEDWTAGTSNLINLTALTSLGVHALTDLTQTITGGNDVITSSHTGTNSVTLLGVGAALTASSFHFA